MRLILSILLILTTYFGYAQTEKQAMAYSKCRQSWQYFDLQASTTGRIIFHKKASVECGILAAASLSLIKTSKGDTIHVLELCNTKKNFAVGSWVIIAPDKKLNFGVEVIPYDAKACSIKRTCFGVISIRN